MKHTPAPWKAIKADRGYIITNEEHAYDIAVVRDVATKFDNESNAQLIAAAPELLSELQECRDLLSSLGAISRNNFENLAMERLDAITMLIAKATGEQA